MNRLGDADLASQDVLIEVVRELEKHQWMLRAQLGHARVMACREGSRARAGRRRSGTGAARPVRHRDPVHTSNEGAGMTPRRSITVLAAAAGLVLGALAVAGCGSSGGSTSSGSPALPKTADGRPATVGVANDDVGDILVDSQGRTLYLFQRDSGTTSACSGACAVDRPPLRVTGKPSAGKGAKLIVATSARSDGKAQITYNGHPLYLFSGDQKPGDTNGQGVNAFGGLWYAVSPTGDQVTTQAPGGGSGDQDQRDQDSRRRRPRPS